MCLPVPVAIFLRFVIRLRFMPVAIALLLLLLPVADVRVHRLLMHLLVAITRLRYSSAASARGYYSSTVAARMQPCVCVFIHCSALLFA